ncbi:conserved Plasmodium protein, unknown function [Plasmodium vinckei lentum]|uniref:Uncharacterized protein n=1 Tax=Plasmodium vinckei lentum TaxID=138297 RepID=A0A6V7SEF4_PLAVN|nr:conserved Plasmodium protein, unknown function [Plasmodium vinckei lentum]
MTKAWIVYWLSFCLFYFEVVRGKNIATKWDNLKKLNTGNNGKIQINTLVNKGMRDNNLDKRTKKSRMNKNSNKLRNTKKSNIKKNGISRHQSSNNHTFLSLKTKVKTDNDDNESINEDESNGNEETVELSTENEANNIMHNQMNILRDITEKIKEDKTVKNIGQINVIDIPSIAQEERKIDDFYEYENKTIQNIRKNKENIYKMINDDLDILLKPAQKEYMKVAKGIKDNLLHEYEEILQEELLEE